MTFRFALAASIAAVAITALSPATARAGDAAPIVLPAASTLGAASAAIEKATGAKAAKLELESGDVPLAEGRSFALPPAMAERLLAGSHASLRSAGLHLFRSERGFGMDGGNDQVALLAAADEDAVIRRVGTSGARRGVTPDKVIAWLHALAKDEPYALVEVAADELLVRLDRAPKDPVALARRAAEIAPDLLSAGSVTVEALADDIRETGTIKLIWD
jgi:hypothetical protein